MMLHMDKRIEEIEKCQDFDLDTLMVHLHYGWCYQDQGCHTFGEDTMKDVRATMKSIFVKPCNCMECRERK
jgi:hypothetical protein